MKEFMIDETKTILFFENEGLKIEEIFPIDLSFGDAVAMYKITNKIENKSHCSPISKLIVDKKQIAKLLIVSYIFAQTSTNNKENK